MDISEILENDLIIFGVESKSQYTVIEELAELINKKGYLEDKNEYIKSVLERERHSTTGIGDGIAIPHGKSTTVKKSTIVFAKTKNNIEWNSLDDKPVNIIFLLAIKDEDKSDNHLKLLSNIATKLMDDGVVKKLKDSVSKEEIISALI